MLDILITSILMLIVFTTLFILTYFLKVDFKYKVLILDTSLIVMYGVLFGLVIENILTILFKGIL